LNALLTIVSGPLAPGLVTAGLFLAVLPWLRRDNGWARASAIAVAVVLMWRYMAWRLFETLPPLSLSADWLTGAIFVVFELLTAVGTTITLIILALTRSRSEEADQGALWLRQRTPPLVDVFICTYNEGQAILETTIVAALGIDYENFRVWILDDGRRPWLEALCGRKGCRYLARPDNAHSKAGNVNHALMHVAHLPDSPEFIAVFDADFAPMESFLRRTLGLFRDPRVALVQTPQYFSNPDPIQANLSVTEVFPDEQRYFFDVIMPSRDAWGIAFCCGTSSVSRLSALEKIGGIPTDSVTEDYLLTLRLGETGYKTVYLNERLSDGLAPEGLEEYASQRSRWALGLIQICRAGFSPFWWQSPLSLRHRFGILESSLYWVVSYPFRLLCVLVPILYWTFGIRAVHTDLGQAVSNYLPYLVSQIAATAWISSGRMLPLLTEVSQLLIVPEITRAVVSGFLKKRGHRFKVTAKGGERGRRTIQWRMLVRFLSLIVATILAIGFAFVFDENNRFVEEGAALSLLWTWYNLGVLALCCLVCIEQPRHRKDERYPTRRRAVLAIGGQSYARDVVDVSRGGFLLRGPVTEPVGTPAILALGNLSVPVRVARKGADHVALQIQGEEARDAMVRHIYSGRYGREPLHVRSSRVAIKLVHRVFR
jgi:cellulose synthase (UDP-forming)